MYLGPRKRKIKGPRQKTSRDEEKRERIVFSEEQTRMLEQCFTQCCYLSEARRKQLSEDLKLKESQVKGRV